jgi:hypothetical protein
MPTHDSWVKAYKEDLKLLAIIKFVKSLGTIFWHSLDAALLEPNHCQALKQFNIFLKNLIFYYQKPFAGSKSYAWLQLVIAKMRNIVFIAFQSNRSKGHLSISHIFQWIWLQFYWPKDVFIHPFYMCQSCPSCALTNPTCTKYSKLEYSFPIVAPFMVLHIDGYQPEKESGFKGSSHYPIACCGMCTFAVIKPDSTANASTYASAIMKIILRFGFGHTLCVLNKDSNFFGVFHEALNLLQINYHVLSKGNQAQCWLKGLITISMRACAS